MCGNLEYLIRGEQIKKYDKLTFYFINIRNSNYLCEIFYHKLHNLQDKHINYKVEQARQATVECAAYFVLHTLQVAENRNSLKLFLK